MNSKGLLPHRATAHCHRRENTEVMKICKFLHQSFNQLSDFGRVVNTASTHPTCTSGTEKMECCRWDLWFLRRRRTYAPGGGKSLRACARAHIQEERNFARVQVHEPSMMRNPGPRAAHQEREPSMKRIPAPRAAPSE